jgi:hypothetical protein
MNHIVCVKWGHKYVPEYVNVLKRMCKRHITVPYRRKNNYLWNDFAKDPARIMGQNHGDQDWIMKRAADDLVHWPDSWIRSYKWEMMGRKDTKIRKGAKHIFEHPPTITDKNLVAVFHGEPKPFNCGDQFVIDNWK